MQFSSSQVWYCEYATLLFLHKSARLVSLPPLPMAPSSQDHLHYPVPSSFPCHQLCPCPCPLATATAVFCRLLPYAVSRLRRAFFRVLFSYVSAPTCVHVLSLCSLRKVLP